MEDEQTLDIFASDLKSTERYFWVLLDSYPQPINQTELAKRAGVTRAAVSRIKDILNKICDLKSLAYERKLVLKKETDTGMSFLMYFLLFNKPRDFKRYISSRYFADIIDVTDIYAKIKNINESQIFEEYFSEEDISWSFYFIKNKIISHEPEIYGNIVLFQGEDDLIKDSFVSNLPMNIQLLYSAFYDPSLSFLNSEKDYIKLLELRDKMYYFITNNENLYSEFLNDSVNWLEIDDPKEYELVQKSSGIIFNHAIKILLKKFTSYIYEECLKNEINIDVKYKKLGSLFHI